MRAKHSIAVLLLLIALCGTSVLKAGDDRFLNLASQSTLPQGRGLAARFDADSGISSDPAVIYFASRLLGAGWDETNTANALTLATPAAHCCGERCLKVEARLGLNQGGGLTKWFEPVPEVFVRFYVRFDVGCAHVHHFVTLRANKGLHGSDKWSGFGGAGLLPAGDERFSTALEPWGNRGRWSAPGKWNFYSYWHEMNRSGDGKYWGQLFFARGTRDDPQKPMDLRRVHAQAKHTRSARWRTSLLDRRPPARPLARH